MSTAQNDNSTRSRVPGTAAISDDEMRRFAPSVFASQPIEGVSERYSFLPTSSILNGMRENGWVPVRAQEQSIRTEARRGFQKHVVRFARVEHLQSWEKNQVRPEVVLVNSHNKSSAYQLHCGLFRLVCTNGMVVSDAVIQMKVGDYFVQGRRRWIRLHEKGGKEHDVPCHHRLDQYLHDYIEAAGIGDDTDGYLFRTARRKTGQLTTNPLFQQDAYRVIRRRAKAAGIETRIGNHSFRATGITAYLKNSGKLEVAQQIANHESPRATKLYDRRTDEISLDEIERIAI